MCFGLPVPGIAQVTAGCDTIHLRKYCAQLAMPSSAAHGGSALPLRSPEERAFGERAVGDDRHLFLSCQRKNPFLRVALAQRVVDLHEVVPTRVQQALHLGISG